MAADAPVARSREEVEGLLEAYQAELDKAALRGAAEYGRVFDEARPGLGVHEIDAGKLLRRVGRGALALLGYRAEELLGRRVFELIVMSETAQRAIDKKLTGAAELKPFVRSFIRADGSSITLLLLDRHLKDAKGKVVGIRTAFAPLKAEA
jgi:PAS domain S-box-containing protein